MELLTNQSIQELSDSIKNFDTRYQYSDDHSKYTYWSRRKSQILKKIKSLSKEDLICLCDSISPEMKQYFNIQLP